MQHKWNPNILEFQNFQIRIDETPIGGYRGEAESLILEHKENEPFTKWNSTDHNIAASLIQRILFVHEDAGIKNTLIIGRQNFTLSENSSETSFELKFVPYPKCNWIEKIQGFIHVIFGSPRLKKDELKTIRKFYEDKFKFHSVLKIEEFKGNPSEKGEDLFCDNKVLDTQKIAQITTKNSNYHLLYDNRPRGATAKDPHLLIIPEGESGHADGSKVPVVQRQEMLAIAQKAMINLSKKMDCSTAIFVERNGEKLRGVHHKSIHLIGIKKFPNTFWEKICAFARQCFASKCHNLSEIIKSLESYNWSPR
jgi:hypothetical protein